MGGDTGEGGTRLPRIIYLGGLGRSGSTLIERLLGELPGVCAIGEAVHMWQRGITEGERCGCGEPFPACPFWRKVGESGFGGWSRVDVGRVARLRAAVDRNRFIPFLAGRAARPGFRRDLAEYLSYYERLYAAVSEVGGCDTVVDSSKHASLAFCLRHSPGLDVRVVHVVRDSRAVAHSWATQVSRPDAAGESYMTTYAPVTSAVHWNVQNLALHALARTSTPSLLVRYEDFVNSPADTMRRIMAFAGLPVDGSAMRFLGGGGDGRWANLGTAHTASGNRIRFLTGRIDIRPDERWRSAMPAPQRRVVTAATLPLLARYGYLHRPL